VAAATLGRAVRTEIQALRALAVALVLAYHLWPGTVRGGFIGVDVFFVISGYLITAHLLREADATGRVAPFAFWARRARRILPAALLVLLACTLATLAFVSRLQWEPFLAEIRASALYVENWHLAGAAVDYLAADDAPTPVRHFWSLSAEEQFYLVWPLLILAGASRGRRTVAGLLGAVTLLSLAWSVWATATSPEAAYFVTPARAWEFGAGGLLAFVVRPGTASPRTGAAVSWVGLVGIAIAAVVYSSSTPFPGVAALLPVLGTMAVIWAATPTAPLTARPVQWLGDSSYSVYLWHWPLLVFAPILLAHALTTGERFAVLVLAIALGWLSKVAVEDPVRRGRLAVRARPAVTLGVAGAATAAVVAVATTGTAEVRDEAAQAHQATERVLADRPACFGAAARDPARRCDDRALQRTVAPAPIEARDSGNAPCTRVERHGLLNVCAFGARKAQSVATIALIGDSHASHWRAALDVAAEARRWRALSITHTDCPLSDAVPDMSAPRRAECQRWNREVREWLAENPETSTVFVSQSAARTVVVPPGADAFATRVRGYRDAWASLPASVERVVVLRDTPRALPEGATLECVDRAIDDRRPAGVACALAREQALPPDPAAVAAKREGPRVRTIDLTPFFGDGRHCFAVVGGALVLRDVSHMTTVFGTTLGPYLLRELRRVGM
jgi:peptidoglycan/LPS O-acetylase OafA/YrhL